MTKAAISEDLAATSVPLGKARLGYYRAGNTNEGLLNFLFGSKVAAYLNQTSLSVPRLRFVTAWQVDDMICVSLAQPVPQRANADGTYAIIKSVSETYPYRCQMGRVNAGMRSARVNTYFQALACDVVGVPLVTDYEKANFQAKLILLFPIKAIRPLPGQKHQPPMVKSDAPNPDPRKRIDWDQLDIDDIPRSEAAVKFLKQAINALADEMELELQVHDNKLNVFKVTYKQL